tara:strand:+ start:232 stop:522 length:291 start_codon:yes stop_codon:yes gene_type:complete
MQAKGNKKLAALGKAINVFASNIRRKPLANKLDHARVLAFIRELRDIMNSMPHESQRKVDYKPVDYTDALSTDENKERVAEARALLKRNRNYENGK